MLPIVQLLRICGRSILFLERSKAMFARKQVVRVPHRPLRRLIALETLERRTVLAGAVTAALTDGVLTLTGDAEANSIVISSDSTTGDLLLRGAVGGDAATSIVVDGEDPADSVSLSGVTDVVLDLAGGADNVVLTDLDLAGSLTGSLGAGKDSLAIGSADSVATGVTLNDDSELAAGEVTIGGNIDLEGNGGADLLRLAEATITGDLSFAGGAGNDRVVAQGNLETNVVGGDVSIDVGAGSNVINLRNLDIGGSLTANGEDADNVDVLLRNVPIGADLTLNLSDGADTVSIVGAAGGDATNVAGDVTIAAGAGEDDINIRRLMAENVMLNAGAGDDVVDLRRLEVTAALDVRTARGDDQLTLANLETATLTIGTGGGNDTLSTLLQNVTATNAVIRTGGGNDKLDIRDSAFQDLTLRLGAGNDRLMLTDIDVEGLLQIFAAAGNDHLRLDGVEAVESLLNLGAGNDKVDVVESVFDSLATDLGAGNDHLSLAGNTVNETFDLVESAGKDMLKNRGGNDIDGLLENIKGGQGKQNGKR
jgi:hypothetical protein